MHESQSVTRNEKTLAAWKFYYLNPGSNENYTEANNPNNVSQQTRIVEWVRRKKEKEGKNYVGRASARRPWKLYDGKSTEARNRRPGLLILICIFILQRNHPYRFGWWRYRQRERDRERQKDRQREREREREREGVPSWRWETLFVAGSYFQSTLEPFSWMHAGVYGGPLMAWGSLFSHLSQRGPRGQVSDRPPPLPNCISLFQALQPLYRFLFHRRHSIPIERVASLLNFAH